MDELSFDEVARKYSDFPRTILRKIDTALRGVVLTERALEKAKEEGALYSSIPQNGLRQAQTLSLPKGEASPRGSARGEPNHDTSAEKTSHDKSVRLSSPKSEFLFGAVFRDGTWVLGLETYLQQLPSKVIRKSDPYVLEVIDGKLWLLDGLPREIADPSVISRGEPVEEIHFLPIPKYYGKKTSRGIPMSEVVTARFPSSLAITVLHCHFDQEKIPCKFCFYATPFFRRKEESYTPESLEDIYETVKEALKEEGRWTGIHLVGGSDPRGGSSREIKSLNDISRDKPYEKEVEEDLKVLKTLQKCFSTLAGQAEKIPAVNRPGRTGNGSLPVRAVASAFPREQLLRLKEAGLTAYNSHIEVWDKKLFEWICPGKAKYFGQKYWIESILSAVEIFGRGNVSTQLVAGAELAEPYGFKNIDEALASNLEGVEFFARNGVNTAFCILWIGQGSMFYAEKQKLPSLEYCVRLAKGINEIRKKYKLNVDFQDYRRWASFPDTDLARLDYNQIS